MRNRELCLTLGAERERGIVRLHVVLSFNSMASFHEAWDDLNVFTIMS